MTNLPLTTTRLLPAPALDIEWPQWKPRPWRIERAATFARLAAARRRAFRIPDFQIHRDRYVIFSDMHKGERTRSDDFLRNEAVYCHALRHYLAEDFRLILNGDAEEGWQSDYRRIVEAYEQTVYALERRFLERGPLHYIRTYGNHDNDLADPRRVKRVLQPVLGAGARVFPGVLLGERILIAHGHQGEFNADRFAWFSRRIVRHLWRHIQNATHIPIGGAVRAYTAGRTRDRQLGDWAAANRMLLIAGHTHRPHLPTHTHSGNGSGDKDWRAHYVNNGCCIHVNGITGLEIDRGEVRLVSWQAETTPGNAHGSAPTFRREVLRSDDLGAMLARL